MNIICKIAYKNKIPVYFPNIRGITFADRPYSVQSYFENYREMFRKLPSEEQRQAVDLAKKQLERRLHGEVGVDMAYSTKSAFSAPEDRKRILKESKNIKVLICSHCFYDNPHAYGGMLFTDFYEWLRFLGRISERTSYDWYLKMHPDALPGTLETIKGILCDFPRITLIPQGASFQQLVKEGIGFVFTAYGTVGHECPALGIQVINAGRNPRIAYDFNWHPRSLDEYQHYLLNLDKLHKDINLEQLYEFYYMHHYYVLADDLILESYRQSLIDLSRQQRAGPEIYGYFLHQLANGKHEKIIGRMRDFIDSGKRHYLSRGPE